MPGKKNSKQSGIEITSDFFQQSIRAKETEQQSANASAAVKRRLQGTWIESFKLRCLRFLSKVHSISL